MELETIRDIAIIVLAILSIIQVLLLIAVLFVVLTKLGPLMNTATSTVRTVQATTMMVSELTINPIIRLAGFAAGAKAMAQTLSRRGKSKGGT